VFPRWERGAKLEVTALPKAQTFMRLATNAFNYELLGEHAFTAIRNLVDRTQAFDFVYSDLSAAVERLTVLAAGNDRGH
jgi:hypothetical protein